MTDLFVSVKNEGMMMLISRQDPRDTTFQISKKYKDTTNDIVIEL